LDFRRHYGNEVGHSSGTINARASIRPFGKTEKSLGDVLLPKGMVDDLWLWKQECPDFSPHSFIFPHTDGGFMDTGNYRNRILIPLAEKLGLSKLNFQVLRRTMATLAQGKGSVKDIQAHLQHSKAEVLHVALLRSQKSLFFSPQLY
jgi:integrase